MFSNYSRLNLPLLSLIPPAEVRLTAEAVRAADLHHTAVLTLTHSAVGG